MDQNPAPARTKRPRPPLDAARLEALALRYVERYATTRHRLADYLRRKLRERGGDGIGVAEVAALVERIATLGYVDDRAFADARAAALIRRGYGGRRVSAALDAAGVRGADRAAAEAATSRQARAAAIAYARRRRIGPFAAEPQDRIAREKSIARMVRAGHDFATARAIASAAPGEAIEDMEDGVDATEQ